MYEYKLSMYAYNEYTYVYLCKYVCIHEVA